jgi:UDP-2-acetamido-2-deoxy-ribo-hexuluronate aminotransferase
MQFRDLKAQYEKLKPEIDKAVLDVMSSSRFIGGDPVRELEEELADYVGAKHCITCANGTDALTLAMMTWKIGKGDAVFIPDFTFFASAEIVAQCGATPVFVDVVEDTYNMDAEELESAILMIKRTTNLRPKAVIAVDLFGQPADYDQIRAIAEDYGLYLLEDGAQGFGGMIEDKRACSFGDISTTSFFPAKPLGCYGDGGAVFTDRDEWAEMIRSYCVHGKGSQKYDNVRVGMNSRLDTIQAAILKVKLKAFTEYELDDINAIAEQYTDLLQGTVDIPYVEDGYLSSWAQYTIRFDSSSERDEMKKELEENGIPSMIYYQKPMHMQKAFDNEINFAIGCPVTKRLCNVVLSLPIHPYLTREDIEKVASVING